MQELEIPSNVSVIVFVLYLLVRSLEFNVSSWITSLSECSMEVSFKRVADSLTQSVTFSSI